MAWRAARSLLVLHQQLQAGAPRARPPGTGADEWGLIGDAAHDPTSDHSPHNFPGWGNQIVTAADFPNRPDLGLDAHRVLDDIRRSRDGRVKYGISNGQMFSSYAVSGYGAWTWRPYNPKNGDRHFTHGHLSVVGDARADGTQPWQTIGAGLGGGDEEDDDDMGASFGPINIEREGVTSLTIPPVQAGVADPRPAWLNFCNDTGQVYGLRVWYTTGNETFSPFPGTSNGQLALRSGQRWSGDIPAGTSCLSILRQAIDVDGNVVAPTAEYRAYAGHLTCAIERGAVKR
ncbi:hypothetical protein ACQP1P_38045 [Dactylosporangium sp. CA-052675]|uniref:hypothetical protein n=1 Tax=Dactylosporangium sp. CA-052675 TaxID=3239927 RepID=UPI003D8CA939